MKLKLANLSSLPDDVRKPGYDRAKLSAGIVHIGLGNFHRGHQAWYLHRLMDEGMAHDWAIVGAGVRAPDAKQSGKSAEITGSMIDFVEVQQENGALIAQMAQSEIRIVSLTVTEGGYYQTATGELDIDHTDIQHDIANPEAPWTAFGSIIAAMKLRRDRGLGPFTCQSCDNLQGNGDILRRTVVGLARHCDPDLADWIEQNATFPNSMVDCIVPATGPTELALARSFGIDDAAPVTHENFRQWVIEDKFCAGRPDWDRVGATFTDEVHVFEAMKLRLLNAGHQILATPGELFSVDTIAGTMAHPLIRQLFHKIETVEIVPHVAAVPGSRSTTLI